jgi:hypothetical protein
MYPHSSTVETENTSDLVLRTLYPKSSSDSTDYAIVAQDSIEAQDIQNMPAVSMRGFLMELGEMNVFPTISIYSRNGYDRKHARLLYMNAAALYVWKIMGMNPRQIGVQHRPPHSAVLTFGIPVND